MLFFLFTIIFIFFILIAISLLSTIKIEIKNFKLDNFKIGNSLKIIFSICLFNKIKLFWIILDKEKISKISKDAKKRSINFNKIKGKIKINKDLIKELFKLKINTDKLNLKLDLGLDDAVITSYTVSIIASILGIVLSKKTKSLNNCKYIIKPIYNGQNIIKIKLDSITSIKIVHIIYVIYILSMKGSKKNGRTSNRRSYGYSYG